MSAARRGRRIGGALIGGVLAALLLAVPARAAPPALPADCPPPVALPTAEVLQAWVRDARDRGLLWRLRRDGRVSWLYGTLHIGRGPWTVPGPTVSRALRAADTLALELDLTDPDTLRALDEAVRATAANAATKAATNAATNAAAADPPPAPERLAQLARAHCVDPALLEGQPPALQAMTLSVLVGRRDGLEPAYAQEAALAGFARALGLRVVALETPARQLAALPAGSDAQRLLEQTLLQLDDGRARQLLQRLAEAWERGDLATLADYARWCDCANTDDDRALLAQLNDARNPGLADGLERLHAAGHRVFVAVGALHMTGPQGLPALLARRGWRVERVTWPAAAAAPPPASPGR